MRENGRGSPADSGWPMILLVTMRVHRFLGNKNKIKRKIKKKIGGRKWGWREGRREWLLGRRKKKGVSHQLCVDRQNRKGRKGKKNKID